VYSTVYTTVYTTTPATITIKGLDGKETTYNVAEDVKVFADSKRIQLSDLAKGTRVELLLGKAGAVIYIEAKAESYVGTLVVADSVYQSLTLKVRSQNLTLPIAVAPTVTINDKTGTLADLKAGMQVRVQLTEGKVTSIKAVVFLQEADDENDNGDDDKDRTPSNHSGSGKKK
ncbi:MAG TPA: hypothetical protein VHS59_02285, partial [Bacillota bacterium]|nr:hypothetical protein [Bacillota bacterium]